MLHLYDSNSIRKLEKLAISKLNITFHDLMQRAGSALYEHIRKYWHELRNITIFAGNGNNGGDAYVLAKLLKNGGYKVTVYHVGDLSKLISLTANAYNEYVATGSAVTQWQEGIPIHDELIIDGILGIGVNKELSGEFLSAVTAINNASGSVISIDIATGLDANSGNVFNSAVYATETITFVANKLGLQTGFGPEFSGFVYLEKLGISESIYKDIKPLATECYLDDVIETLPSRVEHANKNTVGKLAIIGGNDQMLGAAILAGMGALRSGVGKVTICTTEENHSLVAIHLPDLLSFPVSSEKELNDYLNTVDAVIIGPGLGRSEWALMCIRACLSISKPLIIDADALVLIDEYKNRFETDDIVLTPHEGEAAELLGVTAESIKGNRYISAKDISSKYRANVLLKGIGSLMIKSSDSKVSLCPYGNSGMAVAGMGDVLAGVIGGLAAQGMSPDASLVAGTVIHSYAGDIAYEEYGNGLMASDIPDIVAQIIAGEYD